MQSNESNLMRVLNEREIVLTVIVIEVREVKSEFEKGNGRAGTVTRHCSWIQCAFTYKQ